MSDQDPYGYHESLKQCSLEQLVEVFNREVGNPGWVTARGFYLSALRQALLRASADCSVVISPGSMSLAHRIRLEGQQLVAETAPPQARATREAAVERLQPEPETWACAQDVVDALVAAFAAKDHARVEELGEQLVEFFDAEKANISTNWVDGAILVTDEAVESALEEFIEDSTRFSDERCAEIREGAALSSEELGEFVHTRAAALFENPEEAGWHVIEITASDGSQAHLVQRVFGCSWEGLDHTFLGIAASKEEARTVAQSFSYLDLDDLLKRCPIIRRR